MVFLVGIGYFQNREFFLRQYFLRDPAEEMGMLDLLQEDLQRAAGYVTYNGQAFDLPVMEADADFLSSTKSDSSGITINTREFFTSLNCLMVLASSP